MLRERAPKLVKWLPSFLVHYLKKKLHEDEINRAMFNLSKYQGLEFNEQCLNYLNIKVEPLFYEKIPETGPILIVANHPLGGLDGMGLMKAVSFIRKDIRFIVNDILLNLKNFGELFVGVNKIGNNAKKSLLELESLFSSQNAILIFPAGLVSRKQGNKIMDLEWSKSFVKKSINHNITVYPVFIEGKNSMFFYRFANFRKFLRIKANLEMLLLPDEMFKQKGQTLKIIFGKKILPQTFDHRHSSKKWAELVKLYIYSDFFQKGQTFEEFISHYE
ncbi:MAG: 1-acyl-sn-glycerol-3-phosphate acyltransferase [Bacteroidia bacterium]|nr:1-acyl-sn-glycerol-3-phosphate acyltransferase [Bacteroidia bacterium]